MMNLSSSFDHRVVDGFDAARVHPACARATSSAGDAVHRVVHRPPLREPPLGSTRSRTGVIERHRVSTSLPFGGQAHCLTMSPPRARRRARACASRPSIQRGGKRSCQPASSTISSGPEIPAEAYYGVHTLRALENFPITGETMLVPGAGGRAGLSKAGRGEANRELGLLAPQKRDAIVTAAGDPRGSVHDQFVVDMIQGGAGTSTNMNANEVIANRALELLGHPRGEYQYLHPNERRQPGAEHQRRLSDGVQAGAASPSTAARWRWTSCARAFPAKARSSRDVLKMGRTQLQDAVPMTLGQEFSTYAVMLEEDEQRLARSRGADPRDQPGRHGDRHRHHRAPEYAEAVRGHLSEITGPRR